VQFRTKSPVAELPLLITIKQTWIVANGADDETIKTKGAGTGPFRVVDFKPLKTRQLFVRNADYWQKGLPKAKCIEVSVVQEATSKLAAIQTNQVDVIQAVDLNTIAALKKNQGVRLLVSVPSTLVGLTVRIDTPPFDDNRVRLAMKKVIDRQKMVDVLLLGFGAVGDDNPIPPTSPAAWRHKVPGQDIEGAKKLLAAAGYSESKPLEVSAHCSDFIPGLVNLCQLYQQMAAQAGIKVDLVTGPASEFFDTVWLKKPFVVTGWGARPPGEALAVAYRADAEWNETHWKRPDYEALLDKANATLNPSKRVAGFRSAAKLLALEGGIIVPMFTKTVAGVRSNCSGYKPSNEFALPELRFVSCKR